MHSESTITLYNNVINFKELNNENLTTTTKNDNRDLIKPGDIKILTNLLNESSSTSDVIPFKKRIEKINKERKNIITKNFMDLLSKESIEPGFISSAERYFMEEYDRDPTLAKEWINDLYLDQFSDPENLVSILHIISNIKYENISPQGPTMALAATIHENFEVKEYGVRAFEKWENKSAIRILNNVKFHESWLQDYLNEVINDLAKEL